MGAVYNVNSLVTQEAFVLKLNTSLIYMNSLVTQEAFVFEVEHSFDLILAENCAKDLTIRSKNGI